MPLSKVQFSESLGRRRLNINGGMIVAQRGTSAQSATSGAYQSVDKSYTSSSHDGAVTKEQSTDVPVGEGFSHSLKSVVTTADTSIAAAQYHDLYQYRFEGSELTQLGYGTSGAKKSSLSFFVKSNITGAYNGTLTNHDNQCKLPFTFTIAAANTWQRVKIENIPAITTGSDDGTAWVMSGNGLSVTLRIYGALGSQWSGATDKVWNTAGDNNAFGSATNVNWLATVNNNFYITGLQWEVNERCSDFEHRTLADELMSCKRYYEEISPANSTYYGVGSVSSGGSTPTVIGQVSWDVEKRGTPSVTYSGTPGSHFGVTRAGSSNAGMGTITFGNINLRNCYIQSTSSPSAMTTGYSTLLNITGSGKIMISADLL